ncbi:cadmium-translocating P-type ATPase [Viridibacillus sp. YIM B01967]|uniref:P-type Cu(+) transporter n=1 Tax=Viridibacillus soli TaxID=2798301 RepID=A0ABS1H541_9BACL|nr:heavy metal translocating P-type ATPase [Viridibacillus soli]MBK3494524.1 cadmium-translocating P-type ATPase [Viridibacillus soli]
MASEQQKEVTLEIQGMTCAACSSRIERGLNKMEGIEQANINLALETGHVAFDTNTLDEEAVIKKIQALGYDANVRKEDDADAPDHKQAEIKRKTRTFIISAILSLPLLWTMVAHFSFTSGLYVPPILMNLYVQWVLATIVQFTIGWQFYKGAYYALRNKSANMDVLVALGTSAAYFYSAYIVMINLEHIGTHHLDLYFETSAVLITLILLGKLFEARAKGHSSDAIKKLMKLQPKTASVERDNETIEIPISEVAAGDILIIKPGASIPVDAEVLSGTSAVNEAMLTGESLPVDKKAGDQVFAATVNENGMLRVKARKIGRDTVLSSIIRIVEEAQGSKAPIQRLADKISGVFVPIVVGIAVLTFIITYFITIPGDFTAALERTIAVLVIACPCALGLATPTSIMAGSGRAAEYGVLFKTAEALEHTRTIDTIVFDKTGTITKGQPVVTNFFVLTHYDKEEVVQLIAAAESSSEHPVAKAITTYGEGAGKLPSPTHFTAIPGHGIEATVQDKDIVIGTAKLFTKKDIILHDAQDFDKAGKTIMYAAIDGQHAATIAVADEVKETSKEAITKLKTLGIYVVMLTGDQHATAQFIAKEVGIDRIVAEVLPTEKASEIEKLQAQGHRVVMVGDGINDAPALAKADIGIAMGTGTDVAIETADVTIMHGDLLRVVDTIQISRLTVRNIKQNLFWALAYNTIGIPIAAAGLLAPWVAGAAMAFSSVSVVLNALRLQRVKL